ncbi:RNA polymerase sigma factor SigJ [Kitasatospora sp. NBC_01250]|uniref:RNA polymerase sigma factor SigJ n=1 Tax=Kitasatospora sp. NBC_01250 TaxID=2903571 RepID=UPI002E35CA6F|nr:RNA polymerase sigma factor SigJ [Kitasatospora sp. NBC_01250]
MEPDRRLHPRGRGPARVSTAAPAAPPVREESFLAHRPMLLSLAYRLLGSVHDAEDTVQDAYLRWTATDRADVDNPAAFLTTTVTRLALDRLRSAAVRRESYVGAWLPEPLPTFGPQDPAETAALRDSASMAVLVLLEKLSPAERAVFVLREAFALPYDEIAAILERPAASCRQLHRRALLHVAAAPRPAPPPDPARGRELVLSFLSAAQSGDLERLKAVLREDVVLTTDGGGKVSAGLRPVLGAVKSARVFAAVFARRYQGADFRAVRFNHAPALLIELGHRRVLYVFDVAADGLISHVYGIVNPDKLAHLAS